MPTRRDLRRRVECGDGGTAPGGLMRSSLFVVAIAKVACSSSIDSSSPQLAAGLEVTRSTIVPARAVDPTGSMKRASATNGLSFYLWVQRNVPAPRLRIMHSSAKTVPEAAPCVPPPRPRPGRRLVMANHRWTRRSGIISSLCPHARLPSRFASVSRLASSGRRAAGVAPQTRSDTQRHRGGGR